MEETKVPRRRWFRFSLRTLFVLATVVGIVLGSAVSKTRSRRGILDRAAKMGALVYLANEKRAVFQEGRNYVPGPVRYLVGDRAVVFIILPNIFPDDQEVEVVVAFPEASVTREHISGDQTPDINAGRNATEWLRSQRSGVFVKGHY